MKRKWILGLLILLAAWAYPEIVCPWVTSDAAVSAGNAMPNTFSMETFHASPAFKGLNPKAFCRKLFEIYYDGRRKNWGNFQKGMTLWAHTPQEPRAEGKVIELDPVLLLNVHGTGYCGIQSGLLEGIYQSRPGGTIGKPAIEARRWFLAGIVHSVTDAFYDGTWHYYDIDLGGWAGDKQKDVWSVADMIKDPKGYYGDKTTIKSKYFYGADAAGKWVDKVEGNKSYAFQDNHMLGHEMAFSLRKGESFTRYFNKAAAGWEEYPSATQRIQKSQKGFFEIIYAPDDKQIEDGILKKAGNTIILAIRSPYNISSSRVEATGQASVSTNLGRTWQPLAEDGLVKQAVNRWDYLLKIENGALTKVTTRGILHPAALPRVGTGKTTMTVQRMADYRMLTYVPDWSTAAAFKASTQTKGCTYKASNRSINGGYVGHNGEFTVPVKAPPGCVIVKVNAMVIGGTGTDPDPNKYLAVSIGPRGKSKLVQKSTDCSGWGKGGVVQHAQTNVNGSAVMAPCKEAEVKVRLNNWASASSIRIYVGYKPEKEEETKSMGNLIIVHGFDGKKFQKGFAGPKLDKGPQAYAMPGAKENEFISMEVK